MNLAQGIDLWEVARKVQRTPASHLGVVLSGRDSRTHAEAIAYACCYLADVSSQSEEGIVGPVREIIAWANFVRQLDTHELGLVITGTLVELRLTRAPRVFTEFKRSVGHPAVGQFLAPVQGMFKKFLNNPDPRSFAMCNQFISFLHHLTLQDINVDVEEGYKELEASLQTQSYPDDLISGLNAIIKEWMVDCRITPDNFRPRHGKGAVAGLTRSATLAEKYQAFGSDALLEYTFSHYAGIDALSYFPYPAHNLDRVCEVVDVPKNINKRRTISKEQASLQFFQQGIRRVIYDYLEQHSFLKRHITLRDQTHNQRLALAGSKDNSFATIDLSSASDRVTHRLVKDLFHGTDLLPFLVSTRARHAVLPSGERIDLRKFAPMGSALCFPIQTLIFAACVEYSVRRAQRTFLGYYPEWSVYGDDIIVADDLYDDVVLVLEALGFVVNSLKSYHSPSRFRESCGVEAYDGVEVSPMRIARRYYAIDGDISACHASLFEGLVAMANAAHERRFRILRTVILRKLLACKVGVPLFSRDGKGAVLSWWPDNYRAPKKWHTDYQASMIQVARSHARYKNTGKHVDDDIAYLFETLRLSENRIGDMFEPDHRIVVKRGTLELRLRSTDVVIPPFEVASRT